MNARFSPFAQFIFRGKKMKANRVKSATNGKKAIANDQNGLFGGFVDVGAAEERLQSK